MRAAVLLFLSAANLGLACGPMFPDAAIFSGFPEKLPRVSYLEELRIISGRPPENPDEMQFSSQVAKEQAQLERYWKATGISDAEIQTRIDHYSVVRGKLAVPLDGSSLIGFPKSFEAAVLPVRPLGPEFPADVADYVEAARLHSTGATADARKLWAEIYARPPDKKRLRGIWSAWMMAKTSTTIGEALPWYERVAMADKEEEDIIGLIPAAKAWLAPHKEDPLERVRMLYDAFQSGHPRSVVDLRRALGGICEKGDSAVFQRAVEEPLLRQLVNFQFQVERTPTHLPLWCTTLEQKNLKQVEGGARLAWALYNAGSYQESARWLAISDTADPLAIWLSAKFSLRSGNLSRANQQLAEAVRVFSGREKWMPGNPVLNDIWLEITEETHASFQGKLVADRAIVFLARKEYTQALESLRHAGFVMDAAYIAERILTTNELLAHVKKAAPTWLPSDDPHTGDSPPVPPSLYVGGGEFYPRWHDCPDNRLRYQLARRLARAGRLREAMDYMPPVFQPIWQHYAALDRACHSGKYRSRELAAITWRQAYIHRKWGSEFFGTDAFPDGGVYGFSYPIHDGAESRIALSISPMGPPAPDDRSFVALVTPDERRRVKRHLPSYQKRLHYRYTASDLAWKAAKLLPDNHPQLAALCTTAGYWTAHRDLEFADRFYQMIVRRCAATPEGKAADERRWFVPGLKLRDDLPDLPEQFKITAGS
ncbi:MAG: hypothetical protein V4733_08250 [Verrucomicrobiota bacterium]